jgi:putative ABC transport system ATP-binding protein
VTDIATDIVDDSADDGRATVVELIEVCKTYPGGVEALRGVNLRIQTGELLAIVGPSGSGKSTLLQVLGCLDRATSGKVVLAGHDVSKLGDRRLSSIRGSMIGFVFQQFHLVETMSALDNVALPLLYQGVSRSVRRRRATECLERVGLAHRREHRPSRLSGGERQRAAIARALVTEPGMLLADEPTGNLDRRTGMEIVDLFHSLHQEGSTVAVITHDQQLATRFPRREEVLDGQLTSSLVSA